MLKIIAGNFSVRFLSAIANLLIAIIISQFLGAGGKGEQSIILATITFILLIDNVIGGASIVYLTPRMGIRSLIVTSYLWSLIVSLGCYLLLNSSGWFYVNHLFPIAILSAMNSAISINSSVLIGKERIQHSNLVNFVIPLFTLLAVYGQFFLGSREGVHVYLKALFFAYTCAFLLSIYYISILEDLKQDKFSRSELIPTFRALFFYGFQNQLAHIFQLLSFRLSYFILEDNWGKKSVGIYSNGLSIVESIWMITSSISLYQYSRISNSNDKKYSLELTEKLTKLGLFLAFIALIPILFIPGDFYIWLFGKDFYQISKIIRYMAPGIWVFNYALIFGHYFSGVGKYYVNAYASFAGFIVTTVFSVFVFPRLNVFEASITAVISYLTTSLIVIFFYMREGGKFVVFPGIKDVRFFLDQLAFRKNKLHSNEQD